MNRVINEISIVLRQFEQLIPVIFGRHPFPPEPLAVLATQSNAFDTQNNLKQSFSLKDLIGDGFLFAVPVFRRTLEVRKTRKIGIPYRGGPEGLKTLRVKYNIKVCDTCGHYYEKVCLCPNCYQRVREETKEIQDKIMQKLKIDPVEKDVIVLYDGEKKQDSEFWNGRRIIEMEKPRPQWFSKNLMQKSTQPNAESKEVEVVGPTIQVKPSDLG
ncbi:hypothetical protein PVAND_001327 [Polypedilum vanderplanki]|uniref:39S ribosomal protein L32, mitochondrial n=1 Tax=Polypedilum vanderplanki TaxID=319348 RepID=A0A9J6BML0_POLVA|nr:hypothetical protein PVAND_001327 [Polypedilum vanderplanki]